MLQLVALQGCQSSDAVLATIKREFERPVTHDHHITSGRITVIGPSDHYRHGVGFQIHILLTVPPNENVVVSHSPSGQGRHEHAEAAVRMLLRRLDHRSTLSRWMSLEQVVAGRFSRS